MENTACVRNHPSNEQVVTKSGKQMIKLAHIPYKVP
jgi:hypothetical protein